MSSLAGPSPSPLREPLRMRLARLDGHAATAVNGTCRFEIVRRVFGFFSRLGDGPFWYALMALFPLLGGSGGLQLSLHMLAAGAVALAIYKASKAALRRPRPYVALEDIVLGEAPLDEYSFPSGHTMHAVAFTVVVSAYAPAALPPLAAVAAMIAASRVLLGLHYPTDVLLGGLLGYAIAAASFPVLAACGVPVP